jgi:hypothetical protein
MLVYHERVRFFNHADISTPLTVSWPIEFDPCSCFDLIEIERGGKWLHHIYEDGDLTKYQNNIKII